MTSEHTLAKTCILRARFSVRWHRHHNEHRMAGDKLYTLEVLSCEGFACYLLLYCYGCWYVVGIMRSGNTTADRAWKYIVLLLQLIIARVVTQSIWNIKTSTNMWTSSVNCKGTSIPSRNLKHARPQSSSINNTYETWSIAIHSANFESWALKVFCPLDPLVIVFQHITIVSSFIYFPSISSSLMGQVSRGASSTVNDHWTIALDYSLHPARQCHVRVF